MTSSEGRDMKKYFLAIPRFIFNLVKLLFGIMGFCMVLALLGFVIAEPILLFGGIFLAIISLLILSAIFALIKNIGAWLFGKVKEVFGFQS